MTVFALQALVIAKSNQQAFIDHYNIIFFASMIKYAGAIEFCAQH
jgi:hypothetical protein